jgi:luciferase family oxidoreductase group 1
LVIAEQFGTLESLYPGRIDLGLGRAPGTDPVTAHALRRTLAGDVDSFPEDVIELMGYFGEPGPGQRVRAVPGAGLEVPIWILGSSLYGAQLAAALGLPYAFASHFAPGQMMEAIALYRDRYRPSEKHPRPYVMLGVNVFAAETDREARRLFSSVQQAFVNLRIGRPGKLPPPVEDYEETLSPPVRAMLDQALAVSAVGAPATVFEALDALAARTQADEFMVTAHIHDFAARARSFAIAARWTAPGRAPTIGASAEGGA